MAALSLRTKVLIPVTLIFLSTILAALLIVHQVVRRQVFASVSGSLATSRNIFQELQKKEWELLLERGEVAAGAPHLKAAVDTGDSVTVQHVTHEMFRTLSSDVLIVTDAQGRVLGKHGLKPEGIAQFSSDSLLVYQERGAGQIGLLKLQEELFRAASLPIVALDASGVYLLGSMIVANRLDHSYLRGLKTLVKSEIALRTTRGLELNTFPDHFQANLDARLQRLHVDTVSVRVILDSEEFLAVNAGAELDYVLCKSIDQVFQPLIRPIEVTMLILAGFAVLAAIFVSRFISRKIVDPVAKLVKATDAITRGDYKHCVEAMSEDELGHLAKRLDEMRKTLQQRMTQLQDQNLELGEALRTLEATQEALLRSEKLVATGKITAQLSHELNNPIHNIQNCLEAARKRLKKGVAADEFIELAYEEVLRIGKLIRQMLDFYRPEVLEQEKADIHRLVRDVLKSSQKLFDEKGIVVRVLLPKTPNEITTSSDQLKQVFLNLILNAVDAMPTGGKLTVASSASEGMILIDIQDTGGGVATEHLSKVFDAFFTTKSKASGVGLGLTVSYGIVRSLGGDIQIESELNKGSKFTVQLPLHREARAQEPVKRKIIAGTTL